MKKLALVLLLVLSAVSLTLAQRTISGNVIDESGESLIGATVLVKGTTTGTVTDIDGNYSIRVPEGNNLLEFSYTGYSTQEVEIGSSTIVNVTLTTDIAQLSEVIVVGYNSVKKSDLTSSVTTVTGDKLQAQPIGGIDNLLQGQSPGLQVIAENGRPGGSAYIRIRGQGSVNASNAPLFIVDGIQITQNDYNAINPNDIQEVSVLKDAAATAIYGSRASNGVVLITTKKGRRDRKPTISYSFQYGQKERTDDGFDMMNYDQKLDYEVALGFRSQESADALRDQRSFKETNWEDILLRTGEVRTHNLSISGGGEDANYHFSLGSYDEQGISIGSNFSRLNGRFNMDFDVTDWLKVGNTLSLSRTEEDELRDRYNVQNPFVAVYAYNAYEPEFVYEDDGTLRLDENGEPEYNTTHEGFSISEAQRNNPEEAIRTNGIGNLYAEASMMENLRFKTQVGGNYQIYRRQYYIQPGSILDGYVGDPNAPGIKTDNGSDRFIFNWFNTLTYDFTLGGAHQFNAMIGTEYYKQNFDSYQVDGKGFPSAQFFTQDNAAEITGGNTSRTQWSLWSQFGELRYNYNSRYLATFSLRRDGSSRFGSENQFGTFFAGSLAWNLASENFMAGSGLFDQLKLRLSAGTSGNEPTGLYWQGTYGFGSYTDRTTSIPNQLSNATIKWEENFNYSVGIDFGILDNRLSGSVDYYNRRTYDLLFPEPLSRTTGWASRLANIGEMLNSGIELELVADLVRSDKFSASLFGNLTTNRNEITNLDNGGEDIINGNSGLTLLREGLPANTFYLVRYAGVDPATGDELYLDKNGNITNAYSADDAVALEDKSPQPKLFGTVGTNLNLFGIDVSASFYYSYGGYSLNYMLRDNLSDGANVNDNQDVQALNYWKQPGDTGVLPAPSRNNNTNTTTRYLQKTDYIRLRNISVGYTLPSNLTQKFWVQNLRVFLQGTNLWTYNPYFRGDPEVGRGSEESSLTLPGEATLYSYPQTMGWTFGVNLTF